MKYLSGRIHSHREYTREHNLSYVVFLILAFVCLIIIGIGIYSLLKYFLNDLQSKDLIASTIQMLGGMLVLLASSISYETLKTSRKSLVTQRLSQALQQIGALDSSGKPNIEQRVGAIYGLEHVAIHSPDNLKIIFEVLTAYIKEKSPWPNPNTSPADEEMKKKHGSMQEYKTWPQALTDIQACAHVLKRILIRYPIGHPYTLQLSNTNLNFVDFRSAYFCEAYFRRVSFAYGKLENSFFKDCQFQFSSFRGSLFGGSIFYGGTIAHSDFTKVRFSRAILVEVDFQEAILNDTSFKDAKLLGIKNIDAKTREQIVKTGGSIVEPNTLDARQLLLIVQKLSKGPLAEPTID